ncbi:hypothetical protein [uncultured Kordia sp.]|uniref:hypothetical protein n=1 Tax=uncultured Kordia sp. TaxID=507699 RepID=UPI00261EB141|nr:hypothetical protein [uncultured Kordia sp.]
MTKKTILFLILTSVLFSSCSTILKSKTYTLKVTSDLENAKVKTKDSIYELPSYIKVERSKNDLNLTLVSDTLSLDYAVKSSPHQTFVFWNLIGTIVAPLYYAIDLTNDKRFHYGDHVYLNSKDTIRVLKPPFLKSWKDFFAEKHPRSKGDFNVSISIPYVNSFSYNLDGFGNRSSTGFFGASAGLEYFYKSNKYIGVKYAGAIDFFVPIPVSPGGETRERFSTTFFEVTDNFKFGRLNVGYGLNYTHNTWRFKEEIDTENEFDVIRKSKSFGITANTYFQLGRSFFIGVIYRPTFYTIKPTTGFQYEHLISLDFAWKIPLRKK